MGGVAPGRVVGGPGGAAPRARPWDAATCSATTWCGCPTSPCAPTSWAWPPACPESCPPTPWSRCWTRWSPAWLLQKVVLLGSLVAGGLGVAQAGARRCRWSAGWPWSPATSGARWWWSGCVIGHWPVLIGWACLPWVLVLARALAVDRQAPGSAAPGGRARLAQRERRPGDSRRAAVRRSRTTGRPLGWLGGVAWSLAANAPWLVAGDPARRLCALGRGRRRDVRAAGRGLGPGPGRGAVAGRHLERRRGAGLPDRHSGLAHRGPGRRPGGARPSHVARCDRRADATHRRRLLGASGWAPRCSPGQRPMSWAGWPHGCPAAAGPRRCAHAGARRARRGDRGRRGGGRRRGDGRRRGPARRFVGVGLVLLPVLLLADAAWGMGGRLTAVSFPDGYPAMRAAVAAAPPGDVLVLPLSSFRRPDWNGSRTRARPRREVPATRLRQQRRPRRGR